jgi:sugar phosphate isomerase/epimerase
LEIVCPSWCPQAETLVTSLPMLAGQGVTAVEILLDAHPGYFDFRDIDSVNSLVRGLDASPIRVHSLHSPFGASYDFSSFDDGVHERGVEAQIETMEMAKLLGAKVIIVHASGGAIGSDRQRRLDRARGVIRELACVAEQSGVVLAIENLPPGYLACDTEEISWLVEQSMSDWVSICFDSGHANLGGSFLEMAEDLLPRAATTHLHDNDGTADQHLFPGQGSIPWMDVGRIYSHCGSAPALMLECRAPEGQEWGEAFRDFRALIGY